MYPLYQRNLLRLLDLNSTEINYLINMAACLKSKKKQNKEIKYLKGKNIALIFELESTRTRCATEIAAYNQGAQITYLHPGCTHIGYKESIEDTSKILAQIYDGILYRGNSHNTVLEISKYSGIPVWNGLTEKFHPTQILSDLLTIKESIPKNKCFSQIKCAYIGDARNNTSNSLVEAAALLGIKLYLIAPKQYWPKQNFLNNCQVIAKKSGAIILCTENIQEGIKYADFIFTDVWFSMGDAKEIWEKKIYSLKNYQLNANVIDLCNNPEVKILHCLPALHDKKTKIGQKIAKKYNLHTGIEITDKIFRSKNSMVFKQSENRQHIIKALMIATLSKNHIYKC